MKKNWMGKGIAAVAVLVLAFCGWKLYDMYAGYQQAASDYQQLREVGRKEESGTVTVTDEQTQETEEIPAPGTVDFAALQAINADVVGWIRFVDAELPIDYPIVHSADNNDYLRKNIQKEHSHAGSIILESGNSADFDDLHTIIYGHNMLDRSMFSTLKQYADQAFYQAHSPFFYIYTPTHTALYQVFACQEVDSEGEVYTIGFSEGADWQQFTRRTMVDCALYDTGITLSESDRVVTLSTCTRDAGARFVVHAKRIYLSEQQ